MQPLLAGLARPYLRRDVPITWLDDLHVCIGEGVRTAVARCTRSQLAWLGCLDGTGPALPATEIADGTDPRALVEAALHAGAIDDAARVPASWRWLAPQVRWSLEPELLAAMHAYGNDEARDAIDRRLAARVLVPGDGPLAHAARAALADAGLAVGDSPDLGGSEGSDDAADLIVLAFDPSPRALARALARADERPHLPLRAFGARAEVGPLVVPGTTSCTRCAELRARDRDRHWTQRRAERLAMEASLAIRPDDRLLHRAAATQAAALARAFLDGVLPATDWADRSIVITLPLLEARSTAHTRHPLCGCSWPGT